MNPNKAFAIKKHGYNEPPKKRHITEELLFHKSSYEATLNISGPNRTVTIGSHLSSVISDFKCNNCGQVVEVTIPSNADLPLALLHCEDCGLTGDWQIRPKSVIHV